VPLLLAAPKYLSGDMSLGSVVQVAAAFVQVQIAFNWILENFMRIAEWLASARRVNDLAESIEALEAMTPDMRASPKTLAGAAGVLVVHDLVLKDRDGRKLAGPISFELRQGQSLHLGSLGPEAASAVLRALADQWSWGSGVVARDPQARIGAAAQRMRWAETQLWELLAATNPDRRHDAEQVRAVLLRVGLGHLSQRLDETANWDQILSEGERQRLAFARLHLAAPEIVLIDDAMHALDEADAAALFADLRASLPTAMLVTAGGSAVLETSASQTLDTGKAPARRPARGSAYRGAKSGTH
jgi:putative ATP-binding cassette transporter